MATQRALIREQQAIEDYTEVALRLRYIVDDAANMDSSSPSTTLAAQSPSSGAGETNARPSASTACVSSPNRAPASEARITPDTDGRSRNLRAALRHIADFRTDFDRFSPDMHPAEAPDVPRETNELRESVHENFAELDLKGVACPQTPRRTRAHV